MSLHDDLKLVLPGRLNELELHQVQIDCEGSVKTVAFTFFLDGNWVGIGYDIETRLWNITICDVDFVNIPLATHIHVCDGDAVRALQKLLVEGASKKPKPIAALKFWRNLVGVQHVKVLPLKK